MKIKKFEASSMKEALEKIKAEMGSDAFILNTRQINKKGPLGFGDRKFLQVTAATEAEDDTAPEPAGGTLDLVARDDKEWPTEPDRPREPAAPRAETYNATGKKADPPDGKAFSTGFETVFEEARKAPLPPAQESGGGRDKPLRREISEIKELVRGISLKEMDLSPLQRDLGELKNLLYNVIRNQTPFSGKTLTPNLFSFFQKLKDNGIDESIAAKMIQIADTKLEERDKENQVKVARYLLSMIKQSIDVAKPFELVPGRPKIVALIGPTGVGKTTTLAKLAAHAALQKRAEVALITLDTYRIAAVEQLKTYAKIMEIPIQVALNVNELRQAIQFHQEKDLLLIDTAGHSQRDEASMNNLRALLAEHGDIEVHLVLSATTKAADLSDIVARFEALNPNYLIFTKLDETSAYGPLFTQIIKTHRPVSFLTMGQNVPEDFEFADRDLLAGLFMGHDLAHLKGEKA